MSTESTLKHHLDGFSKVSADYILEDYVEESVILTADGPVRGLKAIHEFFVGVLKQMPDFMDTFQMQRQIVEGEVAYIVWKNKYFKLGTDTFIVRKDKIIVQTFAGYS